MSVRVQTPEKTTLYCFKDILRPLFTELFLRVLEQDSRVSEEHVLEKIIISDKPGNGGMEVDSGSPISLCEEFNAKYMYVTFFVSMRACDIPTTPRNAFLVLMTANQNHLPASIVNEHRQLIATEKLYNKVLMHMKLVGAGFTRNLVDSASMNVAWTLRDALWYIDTAHEQFKDRGIHLQESFKTLKDFNDYKKNQKSKP